MLHMGRAWMPNAYAPAQRWAHTEGRAWAYKGVQVCMPMGIARPRCTCTTLHPKHRKHMGTLPPSPLTPSPQHGCAAGERLRHLDSTALRCVADAWDV
jgi:hypothetical protein